MCHPRRYELISRPEFREPLTDESDTDDEEMTETDIESEEEIENAEDTSIEESDENDDEIEDIDVTRGEEFSSSNSEEDTMGRRLSRHRRRTRHSQSRIENELSFSGVTFNGFNYNLEPDEITGHEILSPDQIFLRVRWRRYPGTHEIELSVMRDHTPDMILDYLRAVYRRFSETHFP